MAQFGSWSFFSMHSCHSVSGSMCNECMLVGWLVGQMDEWLVIHSNVPNAALYIWNLFVHQVNIYTRTYYIVANAFAIFVYISKSMITLCRPGPGQQKSTITIIVIIDSQFLCCSLDSLGFFIEDQLKRVGWLVGWSFLIDVVVARTALKCCQNIFGSHQYKLHYSFISF